MWITDCGSSDGSEMSIDNEDSSREGEDDNIDVNHTGIDEMDNNAHEDNGMQYISEDLTEQEEQGIYLGEQPIFHPPCNPLLNTTLTNVKEPLPSLDFGSTTFGGEYTPTETLAAPTTTAFPSDGEETPGPVNKVHNCSPNKRFYRCTAKFRKG